MGTFLRIQWDLSLDLVGTLLYLVLDLLLFLDLVGTLLYLVVLDLLLFLELLYVFRQPKVLLRKQVSIWLYFLLIYFAYIYYCYLCRVSFCILPLLAICVTIVMGSWCPGNHRLMGPR